MASPPVFCSQRGSALYLASHRIIPANPQSKKTWRQTQKCSKWEPYLFADLFFFGGGGGFHFFQCSTLPRRLMDKKCKRATVGSSRETGRFHEKLGDSRKNQESWRYM